MIQIELGTSLESSQMIQAARDVKEVSELRTQDSGLRFLSTEVAAHLMHLAVQFHLVRLHDLLDSSANVAHAHVNTRLPHTCSQQYLHSTVISNKMRILTFAPLREGHPQGANTL